MIEKRRVTSNVLGILREKCLGLHRNELGLDQEIVTIIKFILIAAPLLGALIYFADILIDLITKQGDDLKDTNTLKPAQGG